MTFVQGSGSNLFQPMFNGQPISVLFLVENSSEMNHIWQSVFEKGLTPIANTFQLAANASGPLSVIVFESFPTDNGASGLAPRQYSDCQTAFSNMRFNPHSENRISIGRITQGIELLENVKSIGQPPSLHLVVVAAKPPAEDEAGIPLPSDYSPWRFVSQRLVASRIQCHLVVTQEVSVTSLAKLYEETLRLTPNLVEEAYCTSQSRSGIIVRLSTRRHDEGYHDQAVTTSQYAQQIVASRRNSYPMSDGVHAEQINAVTPPFSTEPDASPRLVSQLQSVHGLTKKKVYGAKPAREPFFSGEVREKFAPPPLTMTMGDISSGGGRVLTHSKIDRIGRLGQASPTDTHGRRHMWPRRESRLSTPEAESLGWGNAQAGYQQNQAAMQHSGGAHMSVDASASMAGLGGSFAMDPATTHMSNAQAAMTQFAPGGMADSQWLTQSQQQPMQPQPHHQPFAHQQQYPAAYNTQPAYYNQMPVQAPSGGNYLHNNAGTAMSDMQPQRPFATTYNSYPPFPTSSNSQPTLPTPTVPSNADPVAPSMSTSGVPELTIEELTSVRPPKRTVVSTPADNETFDFSASFVAASRVMFEEEIVPSYPDIPSIGSDVPTQKLEADLAKLDSPADAGELFATRMPKQQQAGSPQGAGPTTLSSSSSSSASSSRGPHGKVPQASASPHQHTHMAAQASAMQRPMAQMAPPPQQQQQQQSLTTAPMPSMTYGGGYHDVVGSSNIGHATFPSTYNTNYTSSSLTGWAG